MDKNVGFLCGWDHHLASAYGRCPPRGVTCTCTHYQRFLTVVFIKHL